MTFDRRGKSVAGAFAQSTLGVLGKGDDTPPPPPYSYAGTCLDVGFQSVTPPPPISNAYAYNCGQGAATIPAYTTAGGGLLWSGTVRYARMTLQRTPASAQPFDRAEELCRLKVTGQLSGAVWDSLEEIDTIATAARECLLNVGSGRYASIYWSSQQRLDNGSNPWPFTSVKGFSGAFSAIDHGMLVTVNANRAPWFITGETLTVEVSEVWPGFP